MNATLSGNMGASGATLRNDKGTAFLINVTVSAGPPIIAGSGVIWNDLFKAPQLSLTNVLFQGTGGQVNCVFNTAPMVAANNLSSDNSCNFGVGRDNINLLLGPLADNGGFTQTFLPQPGQPRD